MKREHLLLEAAELGCLELVRFFVGQGVRDDRAVCWAADNNNFEMVKFLVKHDMKDDDAVWVSNIIGNTEIENYLRENMR